MNEENISRMNSEKFSKILKDFKISLAITSYHSNRLFFLKSDNVNIKISSYKFKSPMGLYIDKDKLTIGTYTQIINFKRNDKVLNQIQNGSLDDETKYTSKILEKDKEKMKQWRNNREKELKIIKEADTLYHLINSVTTGMINIHDIAWEDNKIWMVNSTFSCLSTLDQNYNFIAEWKPAFITNLVAQDKCHLNGMAMVNGKPKYVTTFNKSNDKDFWKKEREHNGTLIDIDTNEILLNNLIMPHSPKYYQNNIYFSEAGTGIVFKYNLETKEKEEIVKLQGFTRGIAFYDTFMFIGLSQVRSSDIQNPLPLTLMYNQTFSGVWIINLEDNSEVAYYRFEDDVEQVYDINIIENSINPELLNDDNGLLEHIFDYKDCTNDFSTT